MLTFTSEGATAELSTREELSAHASNELPEPPATTNMLSSSTDAAVDILEEEDSSVTNAQRALRLLPINLMERSTLF